MKNEFTKNPSIPEEFAKARDIFLLKPDKISMEKIKILLETAALKGYAPAQYYLYSFLWMDKNGIQDEFTALEWCEKAACAGYAPAQYDYALHLLYGDGIRCNIKEATAWLERAAAQKYRLAAQKLYSLYNAGNRIKQDKKKAAFWRDVESGQIDIRKNVLLSRYSFAQEMIVETCPPEPDTALPHSDEFVCVPMERIISAESFESFVVNINNQQQMLELVDNKLNNMLKNGFNVEHIYIVALNNNEKNLLQNRLKNNTDSIIDSSQGFKIPCISTFESMLNNFKTYIVNTFYDGEPHISMEYINSLVYKDRLIFISNFIKKNPDVAEKCVCGLEYAIFTGVEHYSKEKLMLLEVLFEQFNRRGCGYIIICNGNFWSYEAHKNRNLTFASVD